MDVPDEHPFTETGVNDQFFDAHKSDNPLVKQLANYFFRLNEKTGIAKKMTARYGIPYSNKIILQQSERAKNNGRGTAGNDVLVAYIPLLHDRDTTVKAQLTVRATTTDTTFEVLTAGQYSKFGFLPNDTSALTALKVFTLFANHNKNVFGYTRFKMLDNRILQAQTAFAVNLSKTYVVGLQETSSTPSEKVMLVAPPQPSPSCLTVYDMQQAGYTVDYYKVGDVCVITSYGFDDGLGGGSTGEGGGGGGGDSGGGDNDDPCDGSIPTAKAIPCGDDPRDHGWEPLPIEDEPEDPCITAQNRAQQMDSIFIKSRADSVLATIANLPTETKEKGFAMIKKLRINPYNMTDTSVAGYRCSSVSSGTDSSIIISYSMGVLEYTAATLQTHPPIGYAAHSAKDIYEFLQGRLGEESHFLGTFVAAANGSQYAITITDPTQAAAFLDTRNQYLNGTKWNEDSDIGQAFKKATRYFEKKYKDDPNKIHLAYEMAMAAVLKQFGAGITLNKKDSSGNFKPTVVNTSPDPKKPKRTIYTQECL